MIDTEFYSVEFLEVVGVGPVSKGHGQKSVSFSEGTGSRRKGKSIMGAPIGFTMTDWR